MKTHFKKAMFLAVNAAVAFVLLGSAGVASAEDARVCKPVPNDNKRCSTEIFRPLFILKDELFSHHASCIENGSIQSGSVQLSIFNRSGNGPNVKETIKFTTWFKNTRRLNYDAYAYMAITCDLGKPSGRIVAQ